MRTWEFKVDSPFGTIYTRTLPSFAKRNELSLITKLGMGLSSHGKCIVLLVGLLRSTGSP